MDCRNRFGLLLAMLGIAGTVVGQSPIGESRAPAEKGRDAHAWESQLSQVRQQLDLLKLFSAATAMGGVSVNIPKPVQRIPLENIAGMQNVAKTGLKLHLKELKLSDVAFEYQQEPQWVDNRPAVPSLMRFSKVGISVEAKTAVGAFPVKCTFRNGALPVDFECTDAGYTIHVIPAPRKQEARLDHVSIDLGGPGGGRVLSKIFGKKLAEAVLQFGVGQTLKLDKSSLLGCGALPSVLNDLLR